MQHPGFFRRAGPIALSKIVELTGAEPARAFDPDVMIEDIRPLDRAGSADVSFFENPKYADQLAVTNAAACFVASKALGKVPGGTVGLIASDPYRAFAEALFMFYPEARHPKAALGDPADYVGGVHKSAQIESDARIEPGAIVGPEAAVGSGTVVAAGAVIGYRVHVGRECFVGPHVTLMHTLVGNRVIVHSGAQIGQDGFGFAMGKGGHTKVPQIGRVIIQDDVEIGANTTIDRGALRDTTIGEGTKIDNLVQVGHNVTVGRHCVIVAQVALSGSCELEDYVVIGGQGGVLGHLKVGAGAQIAATGHVRSNVPPGARWGGTPAKPIRQWFKELTMVSKLAQRAGHKTDGGNGGKDGSGT